MVELYHNPRSFSISAKQAASSYQIHSFIMQKRLSVIERDVWPKKVPLILGEALKIMLLMLTIFSSFFVSLISSSEQFIFLFPNTLRHWDVPRFTFQKVCMQETFQHTQHVFHQKNPWNYYTTDTIVQIKI